MKNSNPPNPNRKSPWLFFLLTFALSIPLWIIGPRLGSRLPLAANLPVSALQFVTPLVAALILSPGWSGKKALLKKTFDGGKIKNKLWYAPVILLNPLIMLLSFAAMRVFRIPLPADPRVPLQLAPLYFLVFFIAGACEELGWTGYAYEPLEKRWGPLKSSLILGLVWTALHIVPDNQIEHPQGWIFWHRLGSVANRVLIVWLYNSSGKSVLSAILYHDMLNVSWVLFPNDGSHYNPMVTTLITGLAALLVVFAAKPRPTHLPAPDST